MTRLFYDTIATILWYSIPWWKLCRQNYAYLLLPMHIHTTQQSPNANIQHGTWWMEWLPSILTPPEDMALFSSSHPNNNKPLILFTVRVSHFVYVRLHAHCATVSISFTPRIALFFGAPHRVPLPLSLSSTAAAAAAVCTPLSYLLLYPSLQRIHFPACVCVGIHLRFEWWNTLFQFTCTFTHL